MRRREGRRVLPLTCCPCLSRPCSYSFGLCLWAFHAGRQHAWEDAAGKVPGRGAITVKVSRGDRPDPAALRPDTPAAVRALIERCRSEAAAERPTARAIALELSVGHPARGWPE